MRTIAARQDTLHEMTEAYAAEQEAQARMLRTVAHRRMCHMGSHRGCKRCTPEKCAECREDSAQAWSRQRWTLEREANAWLAGEREASAPRTPDAQQVVVAVAVTIAIVLALQAK